MAAADLSDDGIRRAVAELLPGLVTDLVELAAIPSVAANGFPAEPLFDAHRAVVDLLTRCGVAGIGRLVVPGTTAPILTATIPGPATAPTVLIYSHYDVAPAGDPGRWRTPPFTPVRTDGAVFGRGTADSKSNIAMLAGMLQVLGDRPPVTVKLILEGQEEFGSPFDDFPPRHPELFHADAMVIADVGSIRPGTPSLTVALRGAASVEVRVRSLEHDLPCGRYEGAAPDARLALIRALASLHDDAGNVAVPGLLREPWPGAGYSDEEFRRLVEVPDGVALQGTGTVAERIWSGPAITVTGFDAPPADAPQNLIAGTARAMISLRVHPNQDVAEAQAALVDHLRRQHPHGSRLEVTPGPVSAGFAARLGGPGQRAAMRALYRAWGTPVEVMAGGASIPVVAALHRAVPTAETVMFGATDGYSRLHQEDERVLVDEIEKAIVAMVIFLRDYGSTGLRDPTNRREDSDG
ncbi:MAG TPA: M20/M25/M40 family metallo-hydrolase [Microlunatus sp.]